MSKQKEPRPFKETKLRQKAEEQLKKMYSAIDGLASEKDMLKVMHELQVHQIELELQNEELKAAKERAEIAEKKYTHLYDSAPSGYLSLSGAGDILELNYSAAELLNRERDKLVGTRLALFVSDDSQERFIRFLDNVFHSMEKQSCEVKIEKEDVFLAYCSIDGSLSKDGRTLLLSMVDITQNKQAEESLRQIEIDKEALKFKQNFLANMSHEIRTPLTGVLGMIDILELTKLNEEQMDYIHTLKLSGENLRAIINQVLDYSKIEAGKVKLKPSLFEFRSLFDETKAQLEGRIPEGVEFTVHSDPNIPDCIYTDKKRIQQVINNLVANAVKFTPKGSVSLKSQLLTTNTSGKDIMIKISVTDTGIGIPAEMQHKLFLPFSQIDDKDTRDYEGTGLGLSICKELVILLGGKIGLVSEYQKGSTFWFKFPAVIPVEPSRQSQKGQNHEQSGMSDKSTTNGKLRILFADDKQVNQKVISLILNSMGHVVTLASNGEEAVSMFHPEKFDLVLMDIQMPVMDGITATQKLKEKYKDLPPIVGLSASAFEGDRKTFLSQGLDDYLTKPVNVTELKKLIAKIRN